MVSVLFPAKNLTMWKRKKEIIELTKQESNHIEDLVSETSRLENLCDLALKKLSAEENLFIKSQAKFGLGNRFVGFNG